MTTAVAPKQDAQILEQVLLQGDLSRLSPEQRLAYYKHVCESLGLNALTSPFAYITLNGKLKLYALRDATEQLRKLHGVSVRDMQTELIGDVYVVRATFMDATGRTDQATGAVPVSNLKGENLANAYMKAETKCKRRGTLSICGLGMLDETEVESIAEAKPGPAALEAPPLPRAKVFESIREQTAAPDAGPPPLPRAKSQPPPITVTRTDVQLPAPDIPTSIPAIDPDPYPMDIAHEPRADPDTLEEDLRRSIEATALTRHGPIVGQLEDAPITRRESDAVYGLIRKRLRAHGMQSTDANLAVAKAAVKEWLARELGVEHIEDCPQRHLLALQGAVFGIVERCDFGREPGSDDQ